MLHLPNDELLDTMYALRQEGLAFVVATVTATSGSCPRKVGAKMVVAEDGRTFGTVGGGGVEHSVIERARQLFAAPEVTTLDWALSSSDAGNMVCGGRMQFLLEPFGTRPKVFVFGAGHCGRALNAVLQTLRFGVTVIDDRDGLLSEERLPGATRVVMPPAQAAKELALPPGALCAIVTRSHTFDLDTLRALVRRESAYLGLMASKKKKLEMFAALREDGVGEAQLERVHAPIGLDIGAETPEEIAISIAAEMVATLRRGARQ